MNQVYISGDVIRMQAMQRASHSEVISHITRKWWPYCVCVCVCVCLVTIPGKEPWQHGSSIGGGVWEEGRVVQTYPKVAHISHKEGSSAKYCGQDEATRNYQSGGGGRCLPHIITRTTHLYTCMHVHCTHIQSTEHTNSIHHCTYIVYSRTLMM